MYCSFKKTPSDCSLLISVPWHILSPVIMTKVREGLHKAFKILCSRKFKGSHNVTDTQHVLLVVAVRRAAETHATVLGQLQS